jgi:adenosylmethionine-8-amino-7-oxononanoate aminotransferase
VTAWPRTLIDKGGEFAHGFTYSGHPVRLRRGAIANLTDHAAAST